MSEVHNDIGYATIPNETAEKVRSILEYGCNLDEHSPVTESKGCDWRIPEDTKQVGLRGLAQAREVLQKHPLPEQYRFRR